MDILKTAWLILLNLSKILALFGPLIAALIAFKRLEGGQKVICRALTGISGLVTGLMFFAAALFTRSNVSWPQVVLASDAHVKRGPIHFPFPNIMDSAATGGSNFKARFLQLWNDEFFSFWAEVVNPFKVPISRTASDIKAVPNLDGVAFFGVLLTLAVLSILIAQLVDKSGLKQLQAFGLALFVGWYFASLIAWMGPVIGAILMLPPACFMALAVFGGGVRTVRSGDVIRVE